MGLGWGAQHGACAAEVAAPNREAVVGRGVVVQGRDYSKGGCVWSPPRLCLSSSGSAR